MSTRIGSALLALGFLGLQAHAASVFAKQREAGGDSVVVVFRPENQGFLNVVPATVSIGKALHVVVSGGDTRRIAVAPGRYSVFVRSRGLADSEKSWRSDPLLLIVREGDRIALRIVPRVEGSEYAGGWVVVKERAPADPE